MGVYIKGMDMPKSCAGCALYRFGCTMEGKCWNVCAASGKDIDNQFGIGMPVWCPLVPVPAHRRLIDADALRAEFKEPNVENGGWRNPDEAIVHKTGVWAVIDSAPTIIPAEEGE